MKKLLMIAAIAVLITLANHWRKQNDWHHVGQNDMGQERFYNPHTTIYWTPEAPEFEDEVLTGTLLDEDW